MTGTRPSKRESPRRPTVLITTLLGDSVVSTHRLDGKARGPVRRRIWTLLALSASLGLGGVLALHRWPGAAATALCLGLGLWWFALRRAARERRSPHFFVGEGPVADLPLPHALLPAPCYPLVLSTPGSFHLVVGRGMEGIVEGDGRPASFRQLMASGQAWPVAGMAAHALLLPQHGRAFLSIGEATVLVEVEEPGPPMRAPLLDGLSRPWILATAGSAGAHALIMMLVLTVPPPSGTRLEGFPSREFRHLSVVIEDPWHSGAWGRGEAGQARRRRHRSRCCQPPPATRRSCEPEATASGVVGLLGTGTSPCAHLFGGDRCRDELDAGCGLIGNTVGEAGGPGPPAARTTRGGGEVAGGALGDSMHPITVQGGGLAKERIRREIKRHLNEIRFCYAKGLQVRPELWGRVVVNFTIAPWGRVVASQIQQTTLGDREVERCVSQAFFRWSFPRPSNQSLVVVRYPLVFRPGSMTARESGLRKAWSRTW